MTTSLETLLCICGAVASVGAASAVVARWLSPVKRFKDRLEKLETELIHLQESNERRFKKDLEAIQSTQDTDKLILKSLIVLLDHQVTGNGIDGLLKVKKEISDFLIEK